MSDVDNNYLLVAGDAQRAETPGALLLFQRKRLGLSELEVAESLKVTVSRLKSIEADCYKHFTSETYIRGHLRNYARLVGLEEALVLQAYESQGGAASVAGACVELAAVRRKRRWWLVYLVLAALLLLWFAVYQWLGSGNTAVALVEPNAAPAAPLSEQVGAEVFPSSGVLAATADISAVVGDGLDSPAQVPVAAAVSPQSVETAATLASPEEALVVSEVTAAELMGAEAANGNHPSVSEGASAEVLEAAVVSAEHVLSFHFVNACWLKVTDAGGKVLFAGLQPSGSELSLSGSAPFRLVVGNVVGTSLVYNGRPIQLSANGNGNSARLRVGG